MRARHGLGVSLRSADGDDEISVARTMAATTLWAGLHVSLPINVGRLTISSQRGLRYAGLRANDLYKQDVQYLGSGPTVSGNTVHASLRPERIHLF